MAKIIAVLSIITNFVPDMSVTETIKYILVGINVLTFIVYGWDKWKAKHGKWRGITGSVLLIIFKSLISLCFITCLIRISLNLKNDQKNRPHDLSLF